MTTKQLRIGDNVIPLNEKDSPFKTIKIPPRCQYMTQIHIANDISEGLIMKCELVHNIFIPDIFVQNINQTAIIPVLNLNNFDKIIETPILDLEEVTLLKNTKMICNLTHYNERNYDRLQLLHDNLRLEHINQEEHDSVKTLCEKYNDLFHIPNDILTTTKTLQPEIPTTSDIPVHTKTYRYPKVYEEEVKRQIDEMLKDKIIEPSHSPYNSSIWCVPKRADSSGKTKVRLVIDYRNLNAITVGDSCPLPLIEDIIDQLGNSVYFSTLDLSSGFHQMEMAEKDKSKTPQDITNSEECHSDYVTHQACSNND